MGGGKGGGGASIPGFVVDAQQEIAQRSQQLFDITQPALQQTAPQLSSLLQTGGVGARVPIIQNAERAQRGATSNAQRALSEISQRTGAGSQFTDRTARQLARQGERAERAIGPGIAAPLALGQHHQCVRWGTHSPERLYSWTQRTRRGPQGAYAIGESGRSWPTY